MSAAARIPEPDENAEEALDRVIAKIDKALPKIHEKAKDSRQGGKTPTDAFDMKNLKRTQKAFEALSDDPVLSESDEDALTREREKQKTSSRLKIIRFRRR
jgi:hypothetical protein